MATMRCQVLLEQKGTQGQETHTSLVRQRPYYLEVNLFQLGLVKSRQVPSKRSSACCTPFNSSKMNIELLATLLSRTDEEGIPLASEVFGPFDDLEMFLDFDASVANSEERKKQLMLSWAKCGGSSGPDIRCLLGPARGNMTRRILLSLLSDVVAVNYSLVGGKGKLKFCEPACWKAMKHTVKAKKDLINATDYNVEQAVKSWLAHAKERLEKAAK
ncbi:unnamed protein product, partial [Ixodes hexagonus]